MWTPFLVVMHKPKTDHSIIFGNLAFNFTKISLNICCCRWLWRRCSASRLQETVVWPATRDLDWSPILQGERRDAIPASQSQHLISDLSTRFALSASSLSYRVEADVSVRVLSQRQRGGELWLLLPFILSPRKLPLSLSAVYWCLESLSAPSAF